MSNSIIVYGMRRSGLHCICFDILASLRLNNIHIEFINDTDYKSYQNTSQDNKMFLFEDKFYTDKEELKNKKTIIIIRDIYDNITSRLKTNQTPKFAWWSEINHTYISAYKNILKEALGYTDHYPDKVVINYNDYISNNSYRNKILSTYFNLSCLNSMSKEIPAYGGGKSFKDNESRKNVSVSEDRLAILNNQEFLQLTKEYYNYNVLDKLQEHIHH